MQNAECRMQNCGIFLLYQNTGVIARISTMELVWLRAQEM
jgi:hypothetical protein